MKYRPEFPERFGAAQDARAFCVDFFAWYNDEHHHSALGLLPPADVHHGLVEQRTAERQIVLDHAFADHLERFPHGRPIAARPPLEVWINKPTQAVGALPAGEPPSDRARVAGSVTAADANLDLAP